jgi:hypothetical protein
VFGFGPVWRGFAPFRFVSVEIRPFRGIRKRRSAVRLSCDCSAMMWLCFRFVLPRWCARSEGAVSGSPTGSRWLRTGRAHTREKVSGTLSPRACRSGRRDRNRFLTPFQRGGIGGWAMRIFGQLPNACSHVEDGPMCVHAKMAPCVFTRRWPHVYSHGANQSRGLRVVAAGSPGGREGAGANVRTMGDSSSRSVARRVFTR